MNGRPLTPRELGRLAKLDRRLAAGRLRFGLLGAAMGIAGGLAWVALMWLLAPGFGTGPAAPTGNERHPQLELALYWLAQHIGAIPAICVLAGAMFGGAFALFTYGAAWRLLVGNHAALASRALASGQFEPRYRSPLIGWYPTRS